MTPGHCSAELKNVIHCYITWQIGMCKTDDLSIYWIISSGCEA